MGSRPNQSMCKKEKEKEKEKNTNNGSVSWIGYFFLLTFWTISIYSVLSLLSTNLKVGLYELWLSHTSIAIFMVIKWNKICGYFSKLLLPILFWMNLVSCDCVFKLNNSQESETSKTNDAWCISTLRRLKEASPLGLKVSLKSVSPWHSELGLFSLVPSSSPFKKLLHYDLTTILAQIREGRFQTLDQCLIREYQMSLQGISNQVSRDFCEVYILLIIFWIKQILMILVT